MSAEEQAGLDAQMHLRRRHSAAGRKDMAKNEEKMLTLEKFEEAYNTVKKVTQETKLVYSDYFSAQTGNSVYLKPENMQRTGAYKVRGAYYKISTLS